MRRTAPSRSPTNIARIGVFTLGFFRMRYTTVNAKLSSIFFFFIALFSILSRERSRRVKPLQLLFHNLHK